MTRPLPVLATTGRPEHVQLETAVRRALDQLHGQVRDVEAFTADSTVWASPVPATGAEAITRLAAAVAGLLGTPIP